MVHYSVLWYYGSRALNHYIIAHNSTALYYGTRGLVRAFVEAGEGGFSVQHACGKEGVQKGRACEPLWISHVQCRVQETGRYQIR